MVDPWEHQDEKLYKDISNRDNEWQNKLYTDLQYTLEKEFPGRYELHRGYSLDVARQFKDNFFDFIYLDARHDYDGIKEDLEAWWPKLKTGGLMAGHDFIPDGNVKAGLFGVQGACFDFFTKQNREYHSISSKDKAGGREEPQRVDGGWTTWYAFK